MASKIKLTIAEKQVRKEHRQGKKKTKLDHLMQSVVDCDVSNPKVFEALGKRDQNKAYGAITFLSSEYFKYFGKFSGKKRATKVTRAKSEVAKLKSYGIHMHVDGRILAAI